MVTEIVEIEMEFWYIELEQYRRASNARTKAKYKD
jgi:hypothetical protein